MTDLNEIFVAREWHHQNRKLDNRRLVMPTDSDFLYRVILLSLFLALHLLQQRNHPRPLFGVTVQIYIQIFFLPFQVLDLFL